MTDRESAKNDRVVSHQIRCPQGFMTGRVRHASWPKPGCHRLIQGDPVAMLYPGMTSCAHSASSRKMCSSLAQNILKSKAPNIAASLYHTFPRVHDAAASGTEVWVFPAARTWHWDLFRIAATRRGSTCFVYGYWCRPVVSRWLWYWPLRKACLQKHRLTVCSRPPGNQADVAWTG